MNKLWTWFQGMLLLLFCACFGAGAYAATCPLGGLDNANASWKTFTVPAIAFAGVAAVEHPGDHAAVAAISADGAKPAAIKGTAEKNHYCHMATLSSTPNGRGWKEGTCSVLTWVPATAHTAGPDSNAYGAVEPTSSAELILADRTIAACHDKFCPVVTSTAGSKPMYAGEARTNNSSYVTSALALTSKGRGCTESTCISTDRGTPMTSDRFLAFKSWLPFPFSIT